MMSFPPKVVRSCSSPIFAERDWNSNYNRPFYYGYMLQGPFLCYCNFVVRMSKSPLILGAVTQKSPLILGAGTQKSHDSVEGIMERDAGDCAVSKPIM